MARADRGEAGYGGLRASRPSGARSRGDPCRIAAEGPLAASDFSGRQKPLGMVGMGDTKRALEWLFYAGHMTTATRRGVSSAYMT